MTSYIMTPSHQLLCIERVYAVGKMTGKILTIANCSSQSANSSGTLRLPPVIL